jgi:hypothetical protein
MSTIEERIALLGAEPSWAASWTLGGTEFYGEIMDAATHGVWLSCEPITPEEYTALEVPEGFTKSGVGRSQHDAAVFLRPPGSHVDGPLETVDVSGRTFALVARPGAPERGFDGAMVLPVYKSHRVLFAAGRTLELIDLGHGWYLLPQVTEAGLGEVASRPPSARTMPDGWSTVTWSINDDLVVDLPYPARVAIFFNGDIFHGPVRLDID